MYPNWKDAIPLKMKLYDLHGAGGPLHCSMDDGNIDDDTIDWEIANMDVGSYEGSEFALLRSVAMELALILKQMSRTQRRKLYRFNEHSYQREQETKNRQNFAANFMAGYRVAEDGRFTNGVRTI